MPRIYIKSNQRKQKPCSIFLQKKKKSSLIIRGMLFVQKKFGIKIAKETILSTHKKTIAPFSFEFPKNYIVITKS